MLQYTHDVDVLIGLIKALHFWRHHRAHRLLQGHELRRGRGRRGRATTEAVVYASITILITNFFLTLTAEHICGTVMIEVRDLKKSFGDAHGPGRRELSGLKPANRWSSSGAAAAAKACCSSISSACCKPDAGEVLIDGENIVPMNERQLLRVRQKFGMLFQGAALFDSMTVAENIGVRAAARHEH